MRPVFVEEVPIPPDELMERIRRTLADPAARCRGATVDHHAELFVPDGESHFWSPWLSVTVEAGPGGGSLVRGRFGPRPHVWTGFMFAYFSIGTATVFGGLWALSQWSLGLPATLLWTVPAGLAACALVYIASLVGQRIGARQMEELRASLYAAFDAFSEARTETANSLPDAKVP